MLGPDRTGLYRPASEAEVCELVRWAARRGLRVRVAGSAHSVEDAVFTTARQAGRPSEGVDVSLDRFTGVRFDDQRRQVTAEGGVRLGADPRDRTGFATAEAGLCWQLEQRGWALPILPGITHQTVAGCLMTGSAGGSLRHALTEQVVGLRLVDARGEVHELSADRDPDVFDAAGVSLGLLGIVTAVTLQCVERFDVAGTEHVARADGSPLDDVEAFLRGAEYGRVFWWPQRGVEKVSVWEAHSAGPQAAAEPRPYQQLPEVLGSAVPAQLVAGSTIAAASRAPGWSPAQAAVYNAFLPIEPPQRFHDAWWRTIPMDDGLDDRFFPSEYTELWLPAEAAGEAVGRLRRHFAEGGFAATGAYTVEVYGAPASRFWLSPGHARDSVRLNFCWHTWAGARARARYFPQFWELLGDLDPRLHWGKHLGPAAADHPRLPDFLDVRAHLDPDALFLSDYWRDRLTVRAPSSAPPPVSSSYRSSGRPGRRRPLLCRLRPSDATFAERAERVIDLHVVMRADPVRILDAIVLLEDAEEWLEDFIRVDWIEGPDADGRQVVDETFATLTQRTRTFHFERGRHWMASIDACTLPLAKEMMEDVRLEPLPDGRTLLRWRYFYDPSRVLRPLDGVLRDQIGGVLRRSLTVLDERLLATPGPSRAQAAAPAPAAAR